jgi:hypothetical protein
MKETFREESNMVLNEALEKAVFPKRDNNIERKFATEIFSEAILVTLTWNAQSVLASYQYFSFVIAAGGYQA